MSEAELSDIPKLHCPECGEADLVKATVASWRSGRGEAARCIPCDHRFRVDANQFKSLRTPVLGEPYETLQDRHVYMLFTPMRRGHGKTRIAGLVIGLVVGILLINLFNAPVWMFLLFVPGLYIGWWVGRYLDPPFESAPGKCPQCLYDLRGSTGPFCPECGRTTDPTAAGETRNDSSRL